MSSPPDHPNRPKVLDDLRAFRFTKKPSFDHEAVASGSTADCVEESPSKYVVFINFILDYFDLAQFCNGGNGQTRFLSCYSNLKRLSVVRYQ